MGQLECKGTLLAGQLECKSPRLAEQLKCEDKRYEERLVSQISRLNLDGYCVYIYNDIFKFGIKTGG